MAKNTFINSFENGKNANFDRLTWKTNCDVIIEYMQNLVVLSDSSLNSVPVRVLEHVPQVKIDQNMLIFSTRSFTKQVSFHSKTIQSILSIQSHMEHTSIC